MSLFHKNPKKVADKLYNQFFTSMFKQDGNKHILDAPLSVSSNPRKLNIEMNYLIDEMRSHGNTIIRTDPKFVCDSANTVTCHFIIIYK